MGLFDVFYPTPCTYILEPRMPMGIPYFGASCGTANGACSMSNKKRAEKRKKRKNNKRKHH